VSADFAINPTVKFTSFRTEHDVRRKQQDEEMYLLRHFQLTDLNLTSLILHVISNSNEGFVLSLHKRLNWDC